MPTIDMTEQDLRNAMRDTRYWQAGNPERSDYTRWVGEGWRQATQDGGDGTTVVQVRAYTRTRNGRREQVDSYTQTRKAAQAEGGSIVAQSAEMPANRAEPPPIAAPPAGPVQVILIGGYADETIDGPVISFEEGFRGQNPGLNTRRFAWNQREEIEAFIRSQPPGTRIRLVGHSYGGDTAAQIAARLGAAGQPVDLLVTMDPASRLNRAGLFGSVRTEFLDRVRQGARRWINVNATGGSSFEPSNFIAGMGGSWDYAPMGHAHDFRNMSVAHENFAEMMNNPTQGHPPVAPEVVAR